MSEAREVKNEKKGSGKRGKTFKRVYMTALIGILSAIAFGLMYFDFPILFIAPDFYKFDFSEFPVIIGAFALGPITGIIIELLKNLLHIAFEGTQNGFIGEFANFSMGVCYVLPAALLYRFKKTKKRAIFGLVLSTLSCVVAGSLLNAYVLIPMYTKFMSLEDIIAKGTGVHAIIKDLPTFIMFAVAPFNLLKYGVVSVITVISYKHISRVLKNPMENV